MSDVKSNSCEKCGGAVGTDTQSEELRRNANDCEALHELGSPLVAAGPPATFQAESALTSMAPQTGGSLFDG